MSSIRETMVEARKEKGWSQKELSIKMGIKQPLLSVMEGGKQQTVSFAMLYLWATALEIDPWLFLD